jgi:hypothetical protein
MQSEHSRDVVEMLKEHSKETIRNIWENLIAYMLLVHSDKERLITPHPSYGREYTKIKKWKEKCSVRPKL